MTIEPRCDDESGIGFWLPRLRRNGVRPPDRSDYDDDDLRAWDEVKSAFETMFPGRDQRGWFDPDTGSFGPYTVHIYRIADVHWEDSFGRLLAELERRDMLEGTAIWRTFNVGNPDGPTLEDVQVWPPGSDTER